MRRTSNIELQCSSVLYYFVWSLVNSIFLYTCFYKSFLYYYYVYCASFASLSSQLIAPSSTRREMIISAVVKPCDYVNGRRWLSESVFDSIWLEWFWMGRLRRVISAIFCRLCEFYAFVLLRMWYFMSSMYVFRNVFIR